MSQSPPTKVTNFQQGFHILFLTPGNEFTHQSRHLNAKGVWGSRHGQNASEYLLKPSGSLIVIVRRQGIGNACNRDIPSVGLPVQAAFAYGVLTVTEHVLSWQRGGSKVTSSALLRRVKEHKPASPSHQSLPA